LKPKLNLTGVVGDDLRASDLKAFLDAHANEAVGIALNSPGGSVFAGIEMYNAIADHGRVTLSVEGLAASAASLLAMGAKKIIMKPGSLLMLHRASAMTLGNSDAHRKTTALLDKIDGLVVEIYVSRVA
jgi:ATP-dependent protease ClpP protease subunit